MNDLLPVLLVTVLGAVLAAVCSTGLPRRERRWIAGSLLLHLAFALAQVPITLTFYGSSDMFLYFSYGEILAQMMERDPTHVIPEVTALLMHRQPRLPFTIIGTGSATGSMSALAAWSFYLLGPSKYASGVAFAMLSLCGKIGMYRVFRANVEPDKLRYVALATLFLPSFVFWSAGLIKEAVAIAGFGWVLFGIYSWIAKGRVFPSWLFMVLGAVPILLFKPYILFPLALAGGSWYYWARSLKRGKVRIRPVYLVIGAALSVGGIVLLGQQFPEYAADAFSARAQDLQHIGRGMRGGSNFALSGEVPTTLAGQLAYAPIALLAALFRPAIFEVSNLLMLANALETTVLTLLFGRILFTRNLGRVRRQIVDEPFLVFCVVFVLAFGIAVGLTSTNLGTLSRYRSPLLPFFATALLVLGTPRRAPSRDARGETVGARVPGAA